MKTLSTLALSALLAMAISSPANAITVTLDFEGATSFAPVGDLYNGAGSDNYGLRFSGEALALANDGTGPGPNGEFFSNAPTPGTVMFATGAPALLRTMAFGDSLINQISFYYSSATAALGAVQIFSSDDGSGVALASADLSANSGAACTGPYCHWDQVMLNFVGDAHSISFGNFDSAAFDNISVTVTAVPEPSMLMLLLVSAGGLFATARRRTRGG